MASVRMKIQDGILYVQEGRVWRVIGIEERDKPYRDAYRKLFTVLNRWPPDGRYIYRDERMEFA